jgi:hypothetical protein
MIQHKTTATRKPKTKLVLKKKTVRKVPKAFWVFDIDPQVAPLSVDLIDFEELGGMSQPTQKYIIDMVCAAEAEPDYGWSDLAEEAIAYIIENNQKKKYMLVLDVVTESNDKQNIAILDYLINDCVYRRPLKLLVKKEGGGYDNMPGRLIPFVLQIAFQCADGSTPRLPEGLPMTVAHALEDQFLHRALEIPDQAILGLDAVLYEGDSLAWHDVFSLWHYFKGFLAATGIWQPELWIRLHPVMGKKINKAKAAAYTQFGYLVGAVVLPEEKAEDLEEKWFGDEGEPSDFQMPAEVVAMLDKMVRREVSEINPEILVTCFTTILLDARNVAYLHQTSVGVVRLHEALDQAYLDNDLRTLGVVWEVEKSMILDKGSFVIASKLRLDVIHPQLGRMFTYDWIIQDADARVEELAMRELHMLAEQMQVTIRVKGESADEPGREPPSFKHRLN